MSEMSLRAYINKLDSLLSSGAADEVIHHCRHILHFYPKNVAAYRALGRALLLNGRWEEAGAAFRRVLSVIPDDYHANLGLSEVYDQLRKADEAIWHAERAYEQEPNRQDVLDAVRSLYRRYRNVENARVQLTSSALARQSMRNRQYEQALETLRSALNRMSDRLDLKILLARTLWELGDQVQAAETALEVHEKLPDCIDTNRILTRLWLDVQRPSDAQKYLNRIEAVEPYLALELVTGNPADDNAFRIEELDYRISAQSELAAARPDWLQDLGDEIPVDPGTDRWLDQAHQQGTHVLTSQTGLLGHNLESDEQDWMKALDKPLTSAASATQADMDELPAEFAFTSGAFGESAGGGASTFDFDFEEPPSVQTSSALADDLPPEFEQDPMAWLRDAGIDADAASEPPRGGQAGSEDLGELFGDLGEPGTGGPDDPMAWLNDYSGEYRADEPSAASAPAAADAGFDLFFDMPNEPSSASDGMAEDDAAWLTDLESRAQSGSAEAVPADDVLSWMQDDDQFLEETLGLESLTTPADQAQPLPEPEFDLDDFDLSADVANLFDQPAFDDLPQADVTSNDPIEGITIERERYRTGTFQSLNLEDNPDPLDQIARPVNEFAPVIADSSPGVSQVDLDDLFGSLDDAPMPSTRESLPDLETASPAIDQVPEVELGWDDPGGAPAVSGDVPGPRRGLTAMLKDANLDWINTPSAETPAPAPVPPESQPLSRDLGDWLSQFDEPQEAAAGVVPDSDAELGWLADLNADASNTVEPEVNVSGDEISGDSDAQDWFPTGEAAQEVSAMDENQGAFDADRPEAEWSQPDESAQAANEDDLAVPDWLLELEGEGEEAAEPVDELVETPHAVDPELTLVLNDDVPDWLAEAAPLSAEPDSSETAGEPDFGMGGSVDDLDSLFSSIEPVADVAREDELPFAAEADDFDSLFDTLAPVDAAGAADEMPLAEGADSDLDSLFGAGVPMDDGADMGQADFAEASSGDELDWLDQLEPAPSEDDAVTGELDAEPAVSDDSLNWLNDLQPVEMEAEPAEHEDTPTIDFETLFADVPQDEGLAYETDAELEEAPAVAQFMADLEAEGTVLDDQSAADTESEAGTLIFPPGDVAAAAAGLAAAAVSQASQHEEAAEFSGEVAELADQEAAVFELAEAEAAEEFAAEFDEAAADVETGLMDFEPALSAGEAEPALFAAVDEPEGELELEVTPADNAPDWLNAMVPGLDVDYSATEDETIETAFVDDDSSAIDFDDTQSGGQEEPSEVYADAGAGPGYNWLVDMVEEESQQLAPVIAAPTPAPPRRRFVFTRRPLWYKSDASAGADQADVPEWLR